jgi:hypothetical protein
MTGVIARSPVTEGYRAMLLAALAGQGSDGRNLYVEVGSSPQDDDLVFNDKGLLIDPYSIIYPLTGVNLRGTLGKPERAAPLMYQVTSVGRTRQSAQIQADRIRVITVTHAPGGAFLHPLDAGLSMVVSDRRTSEIGVAEAIEGLWQVADTYVLEVQAL